MIMKKIKWPIILVTVYLVCYNASPVFGFSTDIILALYMLSPFLLCWMVYKILKNGIPSKRTFDDYFYDDYDYRRNGSDDE